jgi:hypothetical protein
METAGSELLVERQTFDMKVEIRWWSGERAGAPFIRLQANRVTRSNTALVA